MALVKICGNMNDTHVQLCLDAGVDIIGFVVDYPAAVPWNITLSQAAELKSRVGKRARTSAVVGGSTEHIIEIGAALQPDFLQLHHEENLADIRLIAKELAAFPIKIIKALRVDEDKNCRFEIPVFRDAILQLQGTGIDALLIDASTQTLPGGTGLTLDPAIYLEAKELLTLPLIIAGGINSRNAAALIHTVRPYAIDVLTGVEDSYGIKSPEKLKRLMDGVR